jgi:hypothetical protein
MAAPLRYTRQPAASLSADQPAPHVLNCLTEPDNAPTEPGEHPAAAGRLGPGVGQCGGRRANMVVSGTY